MRVGAIAFFRDSYQFTQTVLGMKLSNQDLFLPSDDFHKKHGYEKEAALLMLLHLNECWGFVVRKINRRNGQVAWVVVNHKDNFTEVPEDEIYLTLNLDDYTFKLWDEMSSIHSLATDKGGFPVRQSPSDTTKNKCVKKDFKIFKGKKILYQIAECADPYYNQNHVFNTDRVHPFSYEPKDYRPYDAYNPMMQKSMKQGFPQWPSNSYGKTTRHAIPFLRTNIRPTKLSVFIPPKEPVDTPRLFFNFPKGIPLSFT